LNKKKNYIVELASSSIEQLNKNIRRYLFSGWFVAKELGIITKTSSPDKPVTKEQISINSKILIERQIGEYE
jgi:hypothetical protein